MGQELERVASSLELLDAAGGLSAESRSVLPASRDELVRLEAGLGKPSSAKELLLATILVDDSTSIGSLIGHVRHGHALMLDALRAEGRNTHVQVQTTALNRGLIAPYEDIERATRLTPTNFTDRQQISKTPLYYQSLLTLFLVMTKAQEEEARGVNVRTYTLIITDGKDQYSGRSTTAAEVCAVVTDMLEFATNHIVVGMGIGENCDFHAVFRAMGIRSVHTAGATADDLRNEFHQLSTDLQLAASSEAGFLQLAAESSGDDNSSD